MLSQSDVDLVGKYIERELTSVLQASYERNRNIVSIGLANSARGVDDPRICFIMIDDKEDIPDVFDIGPFKLKTMKRPEPGIMMKLTSFKHKITEVIKPGDMIANCRDQRPGTLAAIVDKDGQTYFLGCRHVFGPIDSVVLQPKRRGGDGRPLGLVKMEDCELDCALALVGPDVDIDPEIRELKVKPVTSAPVKLGENVVKYGIRTFGTVGEVTMIKGIRIGFMGLVLNQVMIEPTKRRLPTYEEISDTGDSGALWMRADSSLHPTTVAIGLNVGGDTLSGQILEYAFATEMMQIQQKFQFTFKT